MTILLAKDLHRLGTFVIHIIGRSRKFLPQASCWKFEVGKENTFFKGPVLAVAFHEKSHIFLCFSFPLTARQKVLNILV
jgi:hypothetical protein